MIRHHDDAPVGRILARREVLALFGTTAGVALLGTWAPGRRAGRAAFGLAEASAATPACVVRPELTEGPYFVDERLDRSDIRSDPDTGVVRPGTLVTLTFAVSRIDGDTCVPFEGALVDLWHCDALGVYSDVSDAGFNTVGQKFLRGYQLTDADGVARFVTIYPGWYQGRTVHMHFKIRTDPDSTTGLEFTSQLFFDDALTDVVHAQQPYAAKGQRTLRNDGDGIYGDSGGELVLALAADGAGGYAATFEIGVDASGTTTTTTPAGGTTTTTTLAGGSCATTTACLAALESALPEPAAQTSRRAARTARNLQRRAGSIGTILDRAASASDRRERRLLARASAKLEGLLAASERAATRGTLGVPLAPIQSAIERLLELL